MNNPYLQRLSIEITSECNLHCKQCYLWQTKEPDKALSTNEKLDLIDQFAELAPQGEVILSGGEPFLKANETLTLLRQIAKRDLSWVVVNNGTQIDTKVLVEVMQLNRGFLIFSLDSAIAETHDWIRGRPGTFAKASKNIKTAVQQKALYRAENIKIVINSILCKRTLPELESTIEYAEILGVDGLSISRLAPTVLNQSLIDSFYKSQGLTDQEWDSAIDCLEQLSDQLRLNLILSKEDLVDIAKLWSSNDSGICDAPEKSLTVNAHGDVWLCTNHLEAFPNWQMNVREKSLTEIWHSQAARDLRLKMQNCARVCGSYHCNRKGSDWRWMFDSDLSSNAVSALKPFT